MLVTRNKRLRKLAKGEMTICVGSVSKVDLIKHRTLPLPSGSVLNLNNCYLVFALSIDMIGLCLRNTVIHLRRIMVTLFI